MDIEVKLLDSAIRRSLFCAFQIIERLIQSTVHSLRPVSTRPPLSYSKYEYNMTYQATLRTVDWRVASMISLALKSFLRLISRTNPYPRASVISLRE